MSNLTESSTYTAGIYQLERTDPVEAGIGGNGVSNLQAKQLANRTKYLKDHVDIAETNIAAAQTDITNILNTGIITYGGRKYKASVTLSANYQMVVADFGKVFEVDTAGVVFNFPNTGFAATGMTVAVWNNSTDDVFISNTWGNIAPINGTFTLEPGDFVEFVYSGGYYLVASHQVNSRRALLQPGMIQAFAASSPPAGWLTCNGAVLSQTTYAKLYAVVGSTYSYLGAPGAGAFRIPDLRGEFLRGLDQSRGVDAGRVMGTQQAESVNTAGVQIRESSTTWSSAGAAVGSSVAYFENVNITSYGTNMALLGGTETRPRNVALLFCIKY